MYQYLYIGWIVKKPNFIKAYTVYQYLYIGWIVDCIISFYRQCVSIPIYRLNSETTCILSANT